jgi:hypothetical protein
MLILNHHFKYGPPPAFAKASVAHRQKRLETPDLWQLVHPLVNVIKRYAQCTETREPTLRYEISQNMLRSDLRRKCVATRFLGSRVRIPLGAWVFVLTCCVILCR